MKSVRTGEVYMADLDTRRLERRLGTLSRPSVEQVADAVLAALGIAVGP